MNDTNDTTPEKGKGHVLTAEDRAKGGRESTKRRGVLVMPPDASKKPRGYLTIRKRLLHAIKEGASVSGLLRGHNPDFGFRVRDGESVRRTNLKVLDAALSAWEHGEAKRRRAAKSVMKRPLKKAARVVMVAAEHGGSPDFAGGLWIVETFMAMPREMQVRVHSILHNIVEVQG